MLKPVAELRALASLVPFSGVQFLDFGFDLQKAPRLRLRFHEAATAEGPVLVAVETDPQTGESRLPGSAQVLDESATYGCEARDALGMMLDKWVPLPVFRLRGLDKDGRGVFDEGPTNWARAYVTALAAPDRQGHTHRVVMAFDTQLQTRPRAEDDPYVAPTRQDSETEQQFALAHSAADLDFFLGEPWLDEWLAQMLHELQAARGRRPAAPDPAAPRLEHAARYWTFIELLAAMLKLPRFKLNDTVSAERGYTPIQVDLVLDVGNSRTCGILIESDPDDSDRLDLSNSYALELRDLSRPEQVHAQAFESRVEFARASFGRDAIARRTGRGNSFQWPSLVRVGPEAARLHAASQGVEGATGLSSPKRYLWDRRALSQVWRFNGVAPDGTLEPPVSGQLLAYLSEEGDVLRQTRRAMPAVRPKFSRSSMFTLMLDEVLLQAIGMMNAPQTRGRRRQADVPRQLRRIILTIPPAMPLAEQRILRQRAEGAIKLAWESLGWLDSRMRMPPEPAVQISWDEATCTQLVYLYSEVAQKFPGVPSDWFATLGRVRAGDVPGAGPSLRVASIDIGGGTTDLMVIHYALEDRKAIVPRQCFREGFNVAGDDILEALVGLHVLPAIERHMKACGVAKARELVRAFVSHNRGNQSVQEQQIRRQFVTEIAVPAALALMHDLEQAPAYADSAPEPRTLGDILADAGPGARSARQHVETLAADHGAAEFRLDDVPLAATTEALAATVAATIGDFLSDLCEVVRAYDCDVLLLSGRPSRLPVVQDRVLACMPVRPDRLVPMHQYRAGDWYPFRDAFGRIEDPKTTVVVGAMLASLAESQIEGFSVLTSRLAIRSTARFIGEMQGDQIQAHNLLFSDVDLDRRGAQDAAARLKFYSPISIGFRQLPLERWPATPLYFLDFRDAQGASRMRRPLSVEISRANPDAEEESAKEDFRISEVLDADGAALRPTELVLRLQTLKNVEGHWLDTGAISV